MDPFCAMNRRVDELLAQVPHNQTLSMSIYLVGEASLQSETTREGSPDHNDITRQCVSPDSGPKRQRRHGRGKTDS